MPKIQFIGCGSAFNLKDLNSNVLITADSGKKLLIDCGFTGPQALADVGIHAGNVGQEIDATFLTHLHADHAGGYEFLGFTTFFNPTLKGKKIKLFATKRMIKQAWKHTWRGGMESVEGRLLTVTDFFDCQPIKKNEWFKWEDILFMPVQTIHIMNGYEIMESYGLIMMKEGFEFNGPKVFFTGDTQFAPHQIEAFYKQADVIFHDCETAPYMSKVHAHYDLLKTLPKETKEKMWLYHYQPDPKQKPEEDGFRGFVKRGQVFEF